MKIDEFYNEETDELYEFGAAFGRSKGGKAPKMKFRCPPNGPRKSRLVSHPSQCFKHFNVAQSQRMKKTRAKTKVMQARRAKRTKKLNPVSKMLRQLNKFR